MVQTPPRHACERELVGALERARLPHLAQPREDSVTALVQGGEEETPAAL